MHLFLIYIVSIESQAALNLLQPTLIACNTLKLCDLKMCLRLQDIGWIAAQLKKAWIAEVSPKDSADLLVTLTCRAGIEQLTCKVIRECLKLKLAPISVGKNAQIVDRLAKVLQLQ